MRKWFNYFLSLNKLRKIFNFSVIRQAVLDELLFKRIQPPGSKILILSAHPDDDTFAMGGTIFKYTKAKKKIKIVYLCNGNRGNLQRIKDTSLIPIRKREVQEAAKILGVKDLIFWGYEDDELVPTGGNISALESLILDFKPDIIYLPSFWDNHPDHFHTCSILVKTLQKLSKGNLKNRQIFMYEIWTPIYVNRLVDVSDVIEQKKQAMQAHQSQLQLCSYDEAMSALNKYRSTISAGKGFAEGFFACSPKVFLEIYKKLI